MTDRTAEIEARLAAATPPYTRLILTAENLLEQFDGRNHEGYAITAEWGEQRPEGWYEPTFTVHYDQPLPTLEQVEADLAEARGLLRDLAHAENGHEYEAAWKAIHKYMGRLPLDTFPAHPER